jgi:xanthine/uracil permease
MRRSLSPLMRPVVVGLAIASIGYLVAGVAYANYDTGMLGQRVTVALIIAAMVLAEAVTSGRISSSFTKR